MYIVGADSAFDHDLEKALFSIKCNTLLSLLLIFWDTDSDRLGFKVAYMPDVKFTRMELASRVAGVFDP